MTSVGGFAIRPARAGEEALLSDLAFRSKAYWGYDAAFMEACRAELTVRPEAVAAGDVWVAEADGRVLGLCALAPVSPKEADALMLFVEPGAMGRGVGRALFAHMADEARRRGYATLVIDSDPGAAPFYARMGAAPSGTAPSGSIPGRFLPRFTHRLR